jgi:uncharacterized protein (TIGR02271 family)
MDIQQTINQGATVYGADGEKVGTVQSYSGSYIVVEKGFFFPKDYYIPVSAITETTGDAVYLSVTKDDALNQGWDQEPSDIVTTGQLEPNDQYATARTDSAYVAEDTVTVPVHEEHLEASKRMADAGDVRLSKHVVTEQETIEVPVTEERVRVDWRAPSGEVTDQGAVFEEGTIEVPVSREEVDVTKRTVQTGEVQVTKERQQRSEKIVGEVRREVVDVDDTTVDQGPQRQKR